jgi:hypothetical protein
MGQVKNQQLEDEFSRSLALAGSRLNAEPVPDTSGEGGNDNITPAADVLATGIRNKLPDADSLIFGKQNENR